MGGKTMKNDLIDAIKQIEKDKGIDQQILLDAIEAALITAYKKYFGSSQNVRVDINNDTGKVLVYSQISVVDQVMDSASEIKLEEAKLLNDAYEVGDVVEKEVTPKDFGRIAAQTAKQVVVQRIREAERNVIFNEFINRESEIVTGVIQRFSRGVTFINLGKIEALLLQSEQIQSEEYHQGDRIKTYITEVKNTTKGPQVLVSRTHPGLVKRLFELEVPEIHDGVVEIKGISREAGSRTKIAVYSSDENVDPVGACVGQRGARVQNIVNELNGEKIDNTIQIFNYRYINTLTATVALMLLYNLNLIYVLVTKKIPFKDFIKNKFFILGLILVILTPIIANNTITLIFFCVLTLHIYSISKKSITKPTNPIITLKKHKKWIAPLAISVLALSALIIIISLTQKNLLPEVNAPVHKWQNPIFERTQNLSDKIGIALYSLGFYLKLIFIPYPLRFYYGYKMVPDVDINNVWVVLSLLIHIGLALWALKSFNKRKLISYAIIFYLIAIIPFSNIVFPLTGIIAERLLFIASIGFSIAFSIVVIKVSNSIFKHNITKQIANTSLIITLLICIPAAAYTINRNLHWKDRISLYKHDIQFLENSAKANNLYANLVIAEVYEYMKIKKDPTEKIPEINLAIKHYEQAIKIDSTYLNPMHNLGYIYLIIARDYEKAKIYFDKCIELDSTLDEAYLNRGMANYYLKNYNQSINDLEKHYKFDKTGKNTDKVFYYIGLSYLAKGDTTKANTNLLKTLDVKDVSNVVINDIKETFVENKDFDLAIKAVDILIKRIPNADVNYVEKGNYYLLSGDTISAIDNWEIAFEKYNGNFNIAMTLSQYWREQGNIEKAEYFTNKAIEFRKNQNTQQY